MELCSCCEDIVHFLSCCPEPTSDLKSVHTRTTELSTSAKSCCLCRIIKDYVCDYGQPSNPWDVWQRPGEIEIAFTATPSGECTLATFTRDNRDLSIVLWAEKGKTTRTHTLYTRPACSHGAELYAGSPASENSVFGTRPPLADNNATTFGPLIRSWIGLCLSSHPRCAGTMSGEIINDRFGSELPTRLLQVNAGPDPNIVRLVEPGHHIARYCALSHCWGPPNKRPFMTNRSNISEMLSGVSITLLPRTFRDAIALTREIGIEYLWIDSLCIIQGDDADWRLESEKMGQIFEQAFLVIAAAGSRNATEGLFNMPRYPSTRVPYFQSAHQPAGTFNMMIRSRGRSVPWFGPLSERGWASQEWHLARRIIFFMPGGVSWMCKDIVLDEYGFEDDYRSVIPLLHWYSTGDWLWYLIHFSDAQLTIHTDRLIAIQGIANEIQKRRSDKYHLGLWTRDLEAQLLWLSDNRCAEEDIPDLPSWCWASAGGSKMFMPNSSYPDFEDFSVISSVSLDIETNRLSGDANLLQASLRAGCQWVGDCCFAHLERDVKVAEMWFIMDRDGELNNHFFELLDDKNNFTAIGLAVFDRQPHSKVFILPLMSTPRRRQEPLYVTRTCLYWLFWNWNQY